MKKAIVLLILLSACAEDTKNLDAGSDAGMVIDACPTTPQVWELETTLSEGPTIEFQEALLDDSRLRLDIVGRALSDVHGVSFRVRFDPAVLSFESLTPQSAFLDGLFEANEAVPGLIVFAISAIGATRGETLSSTAIASLELRRLQQTETTVSLTRGLVLASDGRALPSKFGAANLVLR